MGQIDYIGNELELFSHAVNWKAYYGAVIESFIFGEVCEVGAGIGATTNSLINPTVRSWIALEPDKALLDELESHLSDNSEKSKVIPVHGTLNDIHANQLFDSILYIDVIEHIEDDQGEFKLAASHLKPGGFLIILVPAFNFLYSPFDKAIGHFRRYDKPMLDNLNHSKDLQQIKLSYYDSLGFMASAANKLLLNKSMPTKGNIDFWDKVLVPISKITDRFLFHSFGKSLIGIWQKPK